MKAKKSFGQHFLNSEIITGEIADGLKLTNSYSHVLEVGPGKGMLTKYLLQKEYDLKVVEADRDMVSYLEKNFPQLMDKIISGDFLKSNLNEIFDGEQFGLIGNFPYNISSQIMFKMLDYKEIIPEMVGMFQKEVAVRFACKHGSNATECNWDHHNDVSSLAATVSLAFWIRTHKTQLLGFECSSSMKDSCVGEN